MVRGLRTTLRNRTSSMQKPTQLCMYTMATHASRRAEWRTSTHGRYKPRASYCCLVPDSDIEMCEVSYHQEQASINALNKNISFCTALLPRCQKDPFPPHPLAWASCVRVFCANLIYFLKHSTRTPNISSIIAQFYRHDIYRLRTEFIRAASARANARPDGSSEFFSSEKTSEYLAVTQKMRTFAVA